MQEWKVSWGWVLSGWPYMYIMYGNLGGIGVEY